MMDTRSSKRKKKRQNTQTHNFTSGTTTSKASVSVSTQTSDTALVGTVNSSEKIEGTDLIQGKPGIIKGFLETNIQSVNGNIKSSMSEPQAKPREEVLAARQAKKKKKGNASKESNPAQEKVTKVHDKSTTVSKTDVEQPAVKHEEKAAETKLSKISEGKSREEILAEREAKRQAKQLAKGKGKEGGVEKQEPLSNHRGVPEKETVEKPQEESKPLVDALADEITALSVDQGGEKSKAQLRAERRAKQEAQRAKKLEAPKSSEKSKEVKTAPKILKVDVGPKAEKAKPVVGTSMHQVKLFAHLYGEVEGFSQKGLTTEVHPAIVRLGTQFSTRVVSGSTARCMALLNALKKVVCDFKTPGNQEFSRGLEAEVTRSMAFLNRCRPVAVSMSNAVKHFKYQVTHMQGTESECKKQLRNWIETYIRDQLEKAAEAICLSVHKKISNGDVILTYGCSSLIQRILVSAHKEKIKFRVVVVDGRPCLEGREMLRRLVRVGINCTYVLVTGMSFIMPEVTKVLLGTHALLANGYVMSRAGSSQVALLAKAFNVPVLVCCETHKFSERVQTDSFVYNELGNPEELTSIELSKWKTIPHLTPLNLRYDVTPPDLVTAVVTEVAVLPCTSVPVILRIKPTEIAL